MIIYNRIWGIDMESENKDFITVKYDGDKTIKVKKGTTYLSISESSSFKERALGVLKKNEIFSLNERALEDETIEFFDARSIEGAKIYKAAVKFIFEVALKTIIANAEVHYLHSVPGGMLAEIDYKDHIEVEDLSKIKREMANIIDNNEQFIKYQKKMPLNFMKKTKHQRKQPM